MPQNGHWILDSQNEEEIAVKVIKINITLLSGMKCESDQWYSRLFKAVDGGYSKRICQGFGKEKINEKGDS